MFSSHLINIPIGAIDGAVQYIQDWPSSYKAIWERAIMQNSMEVVCSTGFKFSAAILSTDEKETWPEKLAKFYEYINNRPIGAYVFVPIALNQDGKEEGFLYYKMQGGQKLIAYSVNWLKLYAAYATRCTLKKTSPSPLKDFMQEFHYPELLAYIYKAIT